MTNALESLANWAEIRVRKAVSLKRRGCYKKAFELLETAAKEYSNLAKQADSTADKIRYLYMKRECLTGMLNDAYICMRGMWPGIMLEISSIDDRIIEAMKERYQPLKDQVH